MIIWFRLQVHNINSCINTTIMSLFITSDYYTRQILFKNIILKRLFSKLLLVACIFSLALVWYFTCTKCWYKFPWRRCWCICNVDEAAANKVVLLTRVSLTGITRAVTIPSPATSLLVYNTTIAGTASRSLHLLWWQWDICQENCFWTTKWV
jgi:hypothetical protein